MADSDDESHGGNSDDEIAELRIQALLTKKVNEAEISPSREPPQSSSYKNVNKSHHSDRSRSFRHFHGGNHGGNAGGRIPVVGAPNYVVDLTPSHVGGEYESNYHQQFEGARNFRRKGNYMQGHNRGRGQGHYDGRGNTQNYNNSFSNPHPAKTQSPSLVLPQDKYANTQPQEQTKPKEKMSARWRRMQGTDSESDSEDTESDSSDSSSDSSGSSSSSSGSSSGSDSDSDDSSVHKHKVSKDGKKESSQGDAKQGVVPANSSLKVQRSSKDGVSKSPPKQVIAHGKSSPQKTVGSSRRSSVSPTSKKYSGSQQQQQQKQSPNHLHKRLSGSPPSHNAFSSSSRPRSPAQRLGSRSPGRGNGRSPGTRGRNVRSRSLSPSRKRSRSPLPWNRGRSPLPLGRSRSPIHRRVSPRRGSRSPLPGKSPSPRERRGSRNSPVRRNSSHSLSGKASLVRRSSRSPLGRLSRSPLGRTSRSPFKRSTRSPLRRGSRSPLGRGPRSPLGRSSRSPLGSRPRSMGRRASRSPYSRRGSRTPVRRRGSFSPLPRRDSRSPIHRRTPPLKGSRSPLPRSPRSPLQKRSSGTYIPRRSSRSPLLKRNSRSPLPRRSTRSPLMSPRSRRTPPLKRRSNSAQRNTSRSPHRRSSRSPGMRRSSRSPLHRRLESRSPVRRQDSRSPFHRHGSRNSVHRQASRSPRPGRHSKSSLPPRGSRSPVSRRHSRSPLHRLSRSPYRELAKSPGETGRLKPESSRKRGLSRSCSPPPWRYSRSPVRRGSRSPLGRLPRSPHRLNKSSPQKLLKASPSGRNIRSPPLQRISKSPLPRRLSRSPRRTRSPAPRRLSRSPLLHSSRSPVSRMISKSPHHHSRSPALRRISRSPLPLLSRSPLPIRRLGDKSPSPRRLHRVSPASHRSYSPNRKNQRFSESPLSPQNYGTRSQHFRRSLSPMARRGQNMLLKPHSPFGRSPSPGGRKEWGHGRRSGSPFERNSRSLSPQNRIGRGSTPPRERNQRLTNRGGRGGFGYQGYDRAADNAHVSRFPQSNALAAAGRLEFPPGFNNYNVNNNQRRLEYDELNSDPLARPGWSQGTRRDERDHYSPHRIAEGGWQSQYQQRDRPGPHMYPHPDDQFDNRGHNLNRHGHQAPATQGARGRGRGRISSPKPLMYRSISPPPHLERSPQRFPVGNRYSELPPQGQNERRRRYSPGRLPPRSNERSRSRSPYSGGPQMHIQGGRGRPLSPRDQLRRGPRTPPIPPNKKLSPRQSVWPEEKGSVQSNRGSPSFVNEKMPSTSGSNQNSDRYSHRSKSPSNSREQFRTRDLGPHHQQYQGGRGHSPPFDRRQEEKYTGDLRDRLGRDPGTHVSQDKSKKGRLQSPQKGENRNRANAGGGRGRGRGNRARRPGSPDRSRRQMAQNTEVSLQQQPRSPSSHQKGGTSSGSWERKGSKSSTLQGKANPKYSHQSPERHGRNGSPWLEPVTPEKQSQTGGDRSVSPSANMGEPQKAKSSKPDTKSTDKGKEIERKPRTNNKEKEDLSSKGKREMSKRSDNNAQDQQSKKNSGSGQILPQDGKKVSVKPKEEQRQTFKNKNGKEKEEKDEDSVEKKKKKRKKKYRKVSKEEGEEDSDDESVKSKSSKKKKKEKKKKKDSKKKKKKHKRADSDSDEVEQPRSKSQKEGKRDAEDLPDLRQTLKRKLDSSVDRSTNRPEGSKKEEKSQRKERDEEKDIKSHLNDESSRKKRPDGKPILVTVRSGEDRKVTSGKPSNKRGGDGSVTQRVSVHDRLGPAKSSWDNKSGRGSGGGGSGIGRQKRGDKPKGHQGGGGGANSSSSSNSRLKMRQ
ncbi:serine/arginine repetitive matrix protein 2-like isoform X2 [Macrobrachium rosenbergii]|uniref:serine/arginine repetitive matrix protein 2-like isoform X2 n=1 Tax=Macrobrachium rosenbergii TaxID=79674 RepID=UPI0034D57F18